MDKKIAIVTGGSSGIGLYAAKALSKAGCTVYEFSRKNFTDKDFTHLSVDITKEDQVFAAVEKIAAEEGHIDILVNNAGFGISGAVEMTSSEESHSQLEVNLFGMDNVTRAVLPYMRRQKCGRIVCTSSIAGIVSIPFQTWYSVSKAAINAYVLGLINEVSDFGITVCAVMPGDIKTGFTDARKKNIKGDDIYSGKITRAVSRMEKDEKNGMAAQEAGCFIAKAALKRSSAPLMSIGIAYKAAAILIKLLPKSLSNYLVKLIYAK